MFPEIRTQGQPPLRREGWHPAVIFAAGCCTAFVVLITILFVLALMSGFDAANQLANELR